MRIVIGCDPSATPSIAVFYDGKYSSCKTCENFDDLKQSVEIIFQKMFQSQPVFAVETAYLGLNRRIYGIQCANIGIIKYITKQVGFAVIEVTPAEWQSTMHCGNTAKHKQLKEASIIVASSIAGTKIESDHEADAINIGAFADRRENLKTKTKKKI